VSVIGASSEWSDLIDPMVPQILNLVIASWETMPAPSQDEKEDTITNSLCKTLRQNRTARSLPFQINTQHVELDPMPDEELGRLDIVFVPLIPREDIYFCLECKRLNVIKNGQKRSYASEYVLHGMLRFITGQYSKDVHHGGMLGYVLDGNVSTAMNNVESNIQQREAELCVAPPGGLQFSSILKDDTRIRETLHQRTFQAITFRIHHLFMGNL
jgi:hypothetical protein